MRLKCERCNGEGSVRRCPTHGGGCDCAGVQVDCPAGCVDGRLRCGGGPGERAGGLQCCEAASDEATHCCTTHAAAWEAV